jgi:hypothetical protein
MDDIFMISRNARASITLCQPLGGLRSALPGAAEPALQVWSR